MAVLLALLSAVGYGAGDFCAGLASRRYDAGPVSAATQTIALVAAAVSLAIVHGHTPTAGELWWGAASGIGSGVGVLALYRGLAAGQMSVTATLSAVLAAVVPAIVGLALGNRLTAGAAIGIVVAVPAIAMVSWQPGSADPRAVRAGAAYGTLAGAGVRAAVHRARSGRDAGRGVAADPQSGRWRCCSSPRSRGRRWCGRVGRHAERWSLAAAGGVLGGLANILFLAATGRGELAIVAVLTAAVSVGHDRARPLRARRALEPRAGRGPADRGGGDRARQRQLGTRHPDRRPRVRTYVRMYAELHCHSAFSFLDGASLPDELVPAALELGYETVALTDHNSVSGSMEFAVSAKALGLRPIHGAEIDLDDGRHLTLLVADAHGWSNLCRILTRAHAHTREGRPGAPPGAPETPLETVLEHSEGWSA